MRAGLYVSLALHLPLTKGPATPAGLPPLPQLTGVLAIPVQETSCHFRLLCFLIQLFKARGTVPSQQMFLGSSLAALLGSKKIGRGINSIAPPGGK